MPMKPPMKLQRKLGFPLAKLPVTATAEFSDPAVTRRLRQNFAESPAALERLRAKNPVFKNMPPHLQTLKDMEKVYGVKTRRQMNYSKWL